MDIRLKFAALVAYATLAAIAPLQAEPVWTPPAPLNSYAAEDAGSDQMHPAIATDGNGNYMAMWSFLETSYSSDGGATWSNNVAIRPAQGGIVHQNALAYAGNGTWLAMWLGNFQIDGDWHTGLLAATSTGSQVWTGPTVVHVLDSNADTIAIDSSSSGTVIATIGSHLFRSTDNGQSWSSQSTELYVSSIGYDNAVIAHAGGDKWLHVIDGWTISQPRVMRVVSWVSNDDGQTWSAEQEHHPYYSVLDAAAAANTMVTVAYDHFEPEANLYLRVSEDSGNTWTTTTLTHSTPFPWQWPSTRGQLEVDQAGNWVLVVDAPSSADEGADKDIIVARSTDPAAAWSPLQAIAAEATATEQMPAMASDGAGNLLVAYQVQVENASVHDPDYDIKAIKSTDAGVTWSAPQYLNSNALTDLPYIGDTYADVAYGDNGVVVATWTGNNVVMFARSDDYGQTWSNTAPATLVEAIWGPRIYYRGNGNWLIWYPVHFGAKYIVSSDNGFTWSERGNFYGYLAAGSGRNHGTMIKAHVVSAWPPESGLSRLGKTAQSWDAPVIIDGKPTVVVNSMGSSWFARTHADAINTSEDDGRTWVKETHTNLPPSNATYASNHAGVVIAAWNAFDTAIYARTSTDNGRTWSQTKLVFENDVNLVERKPVKLVYTGYNKWLLLWTATTGPASSEPPAGPEVRVIKAATSQDNGANWSAASEVPTNWMFSWDYWEPDYDGLEVIDVAASQGHAVVVWERFVDVFGAEPEDVMLHGSDFDLFYNYSMISPPPTAARDWQLFD